MIPTNQSQLTHSKNIGTHSQLIPNEIPTNHPQSDSSENLDAASRSDPRQFVAKLSPADFQQKYNEIVASQEFAHLLSDEYVDRADIDKVSCALQKANVPPELLSDEYKVATLAGHLFQMSLCYNHARH